jgi:CheY-like chemotaxis protein
MTDIAPTTFVMIVDDNPENLHLLEGLLREQGLGVNVFPRGDLALKAARKKAPDLILLDIRMPDMDGFEVCRRLKEDDALAEVPVLFISALT